MYPKESSIDFRRLVTNDKLEPLDTSRGERGTGEEGRVNIKSVRDRNFVDNRPEYTPTQLPIPRTTGPNTKKRDLPNNNGQLGVPVVSVENSTLSLVSYRWGFEKHPTTEEKPPLLQ